MNRLTIVAFTVVYKVLFCLPCGTFADEPVKTAPASTGSLPCSDETVCDVLVVGGGSAGVPAAIQAARLNVKTILVEAGFQLGGNATSGGVAFPGLYHAQGKQVIAGIGWEWVTKTVDLDNGQYPDFSKPGLRHWQYQIRVNGPLYALVAENLCLESGVEIRYYESPVSVQKADPERSHGASWQVITASQGVLRSIFCRQLIDCTGNGSVCALAGCERMREDETQPGTFNCRIEHSVRVTDSNRTQIRALYDEAIKSGALKPDDPARGILVNQPFDSYYIYPADNTTGSLRTQTNIQARQMALRSFKFIRSLPGGESARLRSFSPETGVRETWRVKGRVVISVDDYTSGKVWDDSVCFAFYPVDLHQIKTGVQPQPLAPGVVPTVPLRALLPEGVDNLLTAGRCISADRLALSGLRVQAVCQATGQAAGAAAALAVQKGVSPDAVPIEELKETLRKNQALVP